MVTGDMILPYTRLHEMSLLDYLLAGSKHFYDTIISKTIISKNFGYFETLDSIAILFKYKWVA